MTDALKTIQLRRYEIVEGELDAFIAWFGSTLVPAREAEGFAIEFAYADREVNEFVWATSTSGDTATFLAKEAAYMSSESRAKAFAGQPQRVAEYHVRLIEPIV